MSAAALLSEQRLEVSCSSQCDAEVWDSFVKSQDDGSVFHLSGWGKAIKQAYQYETYYLTARRAGEIAGILALTDARTPLLGKSLVATAFSVGGGPLAHDAEALRALLDEAEKLGAELKTRYIECRSAFNAEGWNSKTGLHATFEAPIIEDESHALASIPRKRRAEIRKAIDAAGKGDLTIRHDGEPEIFYKLYAQSLHRLGTPVFAKTFIKALLEVFAAQSEISVVESHGAPIASLVSFYFKDRVLPYYVGATECARDVRAFDYLYWAVMRRAAEKGFTVFDFGRSKTDSGPYHYKRLWGIEPCPLTYQVKLIAADTMPDVNAANPKFSAFAKMWPRIPGVVANRLGPLLAPNFP